VTAYFILQMSLRRRGVMPAIEVTVS
jgi:hypothetical protein